MSELPQWKKTHGAEADKAVLHPIVQDVMDELIRNLKLDPKGLSAYGIQKVAHYAAQVARAQALGFDPNLLALEPQEAESEILRIAAIAAEHGVPVTLLALSTGDGGRCDACGKPITKGQDKTIDGTEHHLRVYHAGCRPATWNPPIANGSTVRMNHRSPNHQAGHVGKLHHRSPVGVENDGLYWIDYGEPIQWSFGQSESSGAWCSPGEFEVLA